MEFDTYVDAEFKTAIFSDTYTAREDVYYIVISAGLFSKYNMLFPC